MGGELEDILISFLGTNEYKESNYYLSDKKDDTFSTKFVPIAIAKLSNIKKIIMLVTNEAKDKNFSEFYNEATGLGLDIEEKLIPTGYDESERWQIWDKVIESASDYKKVSFDITHSFRLIPFYVFLTIEFLRSIKGVKLGGLYYGLYEKNIDKQQIINVKEVLDILFWINFSSFFVSTGVFPQEVYQRLKDIHSKAYKDNSSVKPRILKKIAGCFKDISSSLNLSQEINIEKHVNDLLIVLKDEGDLSSEIHNLAKPFRQIFERVKNEYESLISNDQEKTFIFARRTIRKATWCFDHGFLTQTVLLLREAIVNVFIENESDLKNRQKREKISYACNCVAKKNIRSNNQFLEILNDLNNLRNTIAHCGYNKNSPSEKNIHQNIEKLVENIEKSISDDNIKEIKTFLNTNENIEIDLSLFYEDTAKIDKIEDYKEKILRVAGDGNNIILTGNAPVWMYLYIAHALHGKAKSLKYSSPVLKDFEIFNHDPN